MMSKYDDIWLVQGNARVEKGGTHALSYLLGKFQLRTNHRVFVIGNSRLFQNHTTGQDNGFLSGFL